MGRMFRVTFVSKGNDTDVEVALSKFLSEHSIEHVLVEKLVGAVYGWERNPHDKP